MTNRYMTVSAMILAVFVGTQLSPAQTPPAAPVAPAAANPAQGPIVTTLRTQWQGVRDKVIAICDIVPEDKLDYKATPDVRSFKELIIHIAGEGYNFLRPLGSVPGVTPPTNAELNNLKNKADLMKALRDSYDWQGKIIDSLTEASATEMAPGRGGGPGSPKWNAIVSLLVDNMDHYGNLVTYVRLNGLVPPSTAARGAGRGGRGGAGGGRGGGAGAAPAAPQATPAQ